MNSSPQPLNLSFPEPRWPGRENPGNLETMKTKPNRISNREIREHVTRNPENLSATVRRNGHVIVRTSRPRGDGGRIPWNMFAGFRDEIAREILTMKGGTRP
jgi:hypothetical protein